jgi:hypothetical protein
VKWRGEITRDGLFFDSQETKLFNAQEVHVATVWGNGTWHTWDEHGTGGENASEFTVEESKAQAEKAVLRQGWDKLERIIPGSEDDAVEALVRCLYLYPNYKVDSRGPIGCIYDALDEMAPEIKAMICEKGADAVYQEFWSEDDDGS